jgi:hypothetical protein
MVMVSKHCDNTVYFVSFKMSKRLKITLYKFYLINTDRRAKEEFSDSYFMSNIIPGIPLYFLIDPSAL